jgi:Flp pilus assembly protein TadG
MLMVMRGFLTFLRKEKTGMAAVEFAFVLPVMLTFFFGLEEVGQALGCRAAVNNMASIGSDLIAQESQVSSSDMSNVYSALNAMLFPYSTTGVKITISSIVDSGTAGIGTVDWSCTQGGTARTKGSSWTLPNVNLIAAGQRGSVIFTEVSYDYASPVSKYFVKDVTWTNTFYSKPRRAAQIALTACPT